MNLLDIIMLIIGAAIIVVSCFFIHNPEKKKGNESLDNDIFLNQYSDSLSAVNEEIIAKTEDYLSKLSNEKIMAVSEYSDQILEKIDRNHEEVVFLYNMLTTKEKELKETLKELNEAQRKTKEFLTKSTRIQDETFNESSFQNTKGYENIGNLVEDLYNNQSASIKSEEILEMYSQGMSVLEISKRLGIGQGEVKLIIDLFKR